MSDPQSLHGSVKLHSLSPPSRAPLVQMLSGSGGESGASAWGEGDVAKQMALLTEERDFLRKYVSRCESELRAYQLAYPELARSGDAASSDVGAELGGGVEELPPWISQAKYMSPLLVAYEARIDELTTQNQQHLAEVAHLKQEYDKMAERNRKAETELENNIKQLLSHMDAQKGRNLDGKSAAELDEDEVSELQEQVQLYKEQIDILNSQKVELENEVARAHQACADARSERDAHWSGEVKKLQAALNACRLERDQFKNSSTNLSQLQIDIAALQKEHTALQKKYMSATVQIEQLESDLSNMTDKEKQAQASLSHAERDLESLLKTLQSMEADLAASRSKEVACIARESAAADSVERMKLEKEQAEQRERSLAADLQRAEDRWRSELEEVQRRHQNDMESLYQKGKESDEKAQSDITNLTLVIAELESVRDKLTRENRNLQHECTTLTENLKSDLVSLKSALSDAQAQALELEQRGEAHLSKLKRAEAEMSRMHEFHARDKAQMNETNTTLKNKIETLTQTNQNLTTQLQRSNEHVSRLEGELRELQRVSGNSISRLQSELADVESRREREVGELKLRLDEAYRLHETSEARATELGAQQELLANKWREENKQIRTTLTRLLTEEKNKVAEFQDKMAHMEARIQQLIRERDQAMAFQTQYEELKSQHSETSRTLSARVSTLTSDVSNYAAREVELLQQLKSLQGKLDRAEIEVKRYQRQYEAARKKAEFLESTHTPASNLSQLTQPLQPSRLNNAQDTAGTSSSMLSSSVGRPGPTSAAYLQPITFEPSLLPPTMTKAS